MIQYIDEKGKPHDIDTCPFCGKDVKLIYLDEEGYFRPDGYDEDTDKACIHCGNCDVGMTYQIVFKDDTIEENPSQSHSFRGGSRGL